MDIALIYFCNACESIGFEIFKDINNLSIEKTISEQLHERYIYSIISCMNCHAKKNYLTKLRYVSKKDLIENYNELEEKREEQLLKGKEINLQ